MQRAVSLCVLMVAAEYSIVPASANEPATVTLTQELSIDEPVFAIGSDLIWGDGNGMNILLRRGQDEQHLVITEFDLRATGTEFCGLLDEQEVTGRLDLSTSSQEQGEASEATLSTVLKVEVADGDAVTEYRLEWSSPFGQGLGGVHLDDPEGGLQPATATATLGSGLAIFGSPTGIQGLEVVHLEIMVASVVAKKECKCTTGDLYLCPDADCDNAASCNNNTGNCKEIYIQ